MKLKNNLGLIGMMGSGKSTIGISIAKEIRFKFIDTDKEIEKAEKKSISKIFEEKGEKYFREIEKNNFRAINQRSKCFCFWRRQFFK